MMGHTAVVEHLKRFGPATVSQLIAGIGISENAVRHHLERLERDGFVEASLQRTGVGRPAKRYALTQRAEGLFPKRYQELLDVLLEVLDEGRGLDAVMEGVADRLVRQLEGTVTGRTPEERLTSLLASLDYGEMLAQVETTEGGWELRAYNCVYRDAGYRFEPVCDVLAKVITRATGLPAERPWCQRDGERACTFTIGRGTIGRGTDGS